MFKENITDAELLNISGGQEYISKGNALSNALNFYIDLLPFTSRKHVRITYRLENEQVTGSPENENVSIRTITQTVERNDMKWSVLSGPEKRRVALPVVAAGFIAVGVGLGSLVRFVSQRFANQSV